jgi:hypothetical protein
MPLKPFAVLPLALSNIATGNEKANRPATHLAQPHPGMRWESTGDTNLWVRGQFSATQAVNFVSLMAANALPGTTIRVRLGTTQAEVDGTAPYDSGALALIAPARTEIGGRYHSHLELPSVVNASWWRIDISGHTGDFSAAYLVFGEKREPSNFYNRDRELGFENLGTIEIARSGVIAATPGVRLRTFLFRLQWMSESEFFDKWAGLIEPDATGSLPIHYWCMDPEATVYRQRKSYLGYMARDPFMRGNDLGTFNQGDFQFRSVL